MDIIPFVAKTAAEAFARIQDSMGPEAVVLNIRQLPVHGLARLWRKPHIEVLACPPGLFHGSSPSSDSSLETGLASIVPKDAAPTTSMTAPGLILPIQSEGGNHRASRWKVEKLLGSAGLIPLMAQRLIEDLETHYGKAPPDTLAEEFEQLRETLRQHWIVADPIAAHRPQVLIGPPGVGKTTVLCKWLTKTVLVEGQKARVFRSDGVTANTAELLAIHGEILAVPVEHGLPRSSEYALGEWRFVDVPGVDWRDRRVVGELRRLLEKISGAEVHLVLNGAYEVPVLLAQLRAFSDFPLSGLFITHLDEEPRWAKLWNLVLGGPLALRFLSAGQNIPGEFFEANSERLNEVWLGRR